MNESGNRAARDLTRPAARSAATVAVALWLLPAAPPDCDDPNAGIAVPRSSSVAARPCIPSPSNGTSGAVLGDGLESYAHESEFVVSPPRGASAATDAYVPEAVSGSATLAEVVADTEVEDHSLRRLVEFLESAPESHAESAYAAKLLAWGIAQVFPECPLPFTVLEDDGSVSFEWNKLGVYLEYRISSVDVVQWTGIDTEANRAEGTEDEEHVHVMEAFSATGDYLRQFDVRVPNLV